MKALILCGISASGKDSVKDNLVTRYSYHFPVSHTTRKKRKDEKDGVHYHFVRENEFNRLKQIGELVEHVKYNDQQYGISENEFLNNEKVVLIMEHHGIKQMIDNLGRENVFIVMLLPESIELMKERLENRDGKIDKSRLDFDEHLLACFKYADTVFVNRKGTSLVKLTYQIDKAYRFFLYGDRK